MATVEFPLEDDTTAIAGFAILRVYGSEGEPITTYTTFGNLYPEEAIGMMTSALDQLRYEFMDKENADMIDLFGPDEDEDD